MAPSPAASRRASSRSWSTMASQPTAADGSMAASRATAPITLGEPGLLAVRWRGPHHLVQSDQVHRPTPGQEGIPGLEERAGPDERPGAEGGVQLVPAEGHEVGGGGQGSVGGQLGGVHHHRHAPLVGGLDDVVDRRRAIR